MRKSLAIIASALLLAGNTHAGLFKAMLAQWWSSILSVVRRSLDLVSQQPQAVQHVCDVGILLLAATAVHQHMPPQIHAELPISPCSSAVVALLLPAVCCWLDQAKEHPVDVLLNLQCMYLHTTLPMDGYSVGCWCANRSCANR